MVASARWSGPGGATPGGVVGSSEKAEPDAGRGFGQPLQDGALEDAVAAPRAGQAEQVHLPDEAAEQRALLVRQRDAFIHRLPAFAVRGRAVAIEEGVIRKRLRVEVLPVHALGTWV